MNLCEIENQLGLSFPPRHKQAMGDNADPVHEACDFLVMKSPHKLLRLMEVNEFLHGVENCNTWPAFLVAFASNGCADYFAYDLRTEPPRIKYIDPDRTVEENLSTDDGLEFGSFETWYEWKVSRRRIPFQAV